MRSAATCSSSSGITVSTPPIRSGRKNADGSRKDDGLKRNQYGATIGGPIKTDRLFFFAGYQGTNTTVNPTDNRAFVPTAAMLAGDFTAFASPACNAGVQRNLGAPFAGNRVSPALFSPAALNITARLPTTTDPCGLVAVRAAERDRRRAVRQQDRLHDQQHSTRCSGAMIATTQFSPPPYHPRHRRSRTFWRRASAAATTWRTSFTLGENYVISPNTLNALRFAYNRTDISRPDIDFFSAPEVGINSFSYLPHYMLLTVTGGFHARHRHRDDAIDIITPSWQISDDLTLVRGGHQYAFGGSFARWSIGVALANVRSPGQFTIDGTRDRARSGGLPPGPAGHRTGWSRRRRTRSTWSRSTSDCTRRTPGGSGPRRDAELRPAMGAVFSAATEERGGVSVRHRALPGGHQEHGVPQWTGGPLLSRRPRLPQPRRAC